MYVVCAIAVLFAMFAYGEHVKNVNDGLAARTLGAGCRQMALPPNFGTAARFERLTVPYVVSSLL